MTGTFPTYELEEEALADGYKYIVGTDEAGRGPGAGPVVAAAVRVPTEYISDLLFKVKDSKKLTPKRRAELFGYVTERCEYGIGVVPNDVIDVINILQATKLAMIKAIEQISLADNVLIDGTVVLDNFDMTQRQVIKGDNRSISIAAASIIAKVHRDEIMETLHYVYPIYNWKKNKGYLTKEHIEAIKTYGTTEWHRLSFKKVGNVDENTRT